MDKLDMFQEIYVKVDEFGWWYMERIKTYSGIQFTSKYFQEGIYVCGVQLALAARDYQEINFQVEVTWQTFLTIAHSIMVHVRVSDKYIHFSLMYITDHIFPVLTIKHLVNRYSEPNTPHKMETITKTSVSNPRVLFCPFFVRKENAHVDTKALNVCRESQKNRVIFVGILLHQKG